MNGDSSRQAIVVGGGVIGCMSAYYLAERGWKVRLLEAGRLGGGASHGNCGYVCPSHVLPLAMPGALRGVLASVARRDSPVYLKPRWDPQLWRWLMRFAGRCREEFVLPTARARHALLRSSMALYRDLVARESIDCQWQDQGLLLVFPTRRGFEHYRRTANLLREQFDFPVTAYEGEAVTELEPALRPRQAGGWLLQGDAHLRPDRLMAELGRVLRTRGVTVEEQTPVLRLAIESGRAHGVHTADGLQRAHAVVIASGARTPGFARELGCPVPIQPAKGYSLTYPPPQRPPRIPLIFEGCHVAITPMATALRVGSTMEFAGY
ncbi:MAG TPA: FAD-dependent oxidoreductase, partial [Lacipirellulaceae bacterium]|nr:FAD-dependent oxidoreductase [Lacipirellulaceae bacterium]